MSSPSTNNILMVLLGAFLGVIGWREFERFQDEALVKQKMALDGIGIEPSVVDTYRPPDPPNPAPGFMKDHEMTDRVVCHLCEHVNEGIPFDDYHPECENCGNIMHRD